MHLTTGMMWKESVFIALSAILGLIIRPGEAIRYEPTWESLDKRPLPQWYDEAKFGIFICIGLYSVPAYKTEWFWNNWVAGDKDLGNFMARNYPPNFTYQDFAALYSASFFDANQWADILQASGAGYIVFTTKHHEGFTNWPSKYSWNWNSMDVGPKRDLVGELASALRNKTKMRLGLYHSMFEWFHPLYLQDKKNNYTTQKFVMEKTLPELYEIVNAYKPEVIWSDGDWQAPYEYWNSTEFLAWLYNESPVKDSVVVNDRWGIGTHCHHGDYYTCQDRYNPGVLQKHKWENAMTIDCCSWGSRRDAKYSDYMSIEGLLKIMAETISCGGNLLMNIAPTGDGRIIPIFEQRLRQMGQWLKVNGDSIYSSKPWSHQNDTLTKDVWYTSKKTENGTNVYAIVLSWPKSDTLILGSPLTTSQTTVSMLGYQGMFKWIARPGGGIMITVPPIPINQLPTPWAWVFRLTGLSN